jgi:hypothetical protein
MALNRELAASNAEADRAHAFDPTPEGMTNVGLGAGWSKEPRYSGSLRRRSSTSKRFVLCAIRWSPLGGRATAGHRDDVEAFTKIGHGLAKFVRSSRLQVAIHEHVVTRQVSSPRVTPSEQAPVRGWPRSPIPFAVKRDPTARRARRTPTRVLPSSSVKRDRSNGTLHA